MAAIVKNYKYPYQKTTSNKGEPESHQVRVFQAAIHQIPHYKIWYKRITYLPNAFEKIGMIIFHDHFFP
jgi:hypothetical protein